MRNIDNLVFLLRRKIISSFIPFIGTNLWMNLSAITNNERKIVAVA